MKNVRYPRKCDVTGDPMLSGYCINEGEMYIKDEKTMYEWLRKQGLNPEDEFSTINTEHEWFYYTEWEVPNEDEEHYLSDGTYIPEV